MARKMSLPSRLLGPQGLKSVRENSVVPPGLESFFPLFPALKRWAKFGRPSGAGLSGISFHRIAKKRVLTHTLKRWAKLGRPFGAPVLVRASNYGQQNLRWMFSVVIYADPVSYTHLRA